MREQIALSRIEVEQARLLVLKTAWLIDSAGAKGAATEIAAIKVAVPRMACTVIDRAIQIHGGGGITDNTPLPAFYAWARALRLADGPDEVHLRTVARQELGRHPTVRRVSTSHDGESSFSAHGESVAFRRR